MCKLLTKFRQYDRVHDTRLQQDVMLVTAISTTDYGNGIFWIAFDENNQYVIVCVDDFEDT